MNRFEKTEELPPEKDDFKTFEKRMAEMQLHEAIIERIKRHEPFTEKEKNYIESKAQRLSPEARKVFENVAKLEPSLLEIIISPERLMEALLEWPDDHIINLFHFPGLNSSPLPGSKLEETKKLNDTRKSLGLPPF